MDRFEDMPALNLNEKDPITGSGSPSHNSNPVSPDYPHSVENDHSHENLNAELENLDLKEHVIEQPQPGREVEYVPPKAGSEPESEGEDHNEKMGDDRNEEEGGEHIEEGGEEEVREDGWRSEGRVENDKELDGWNENEQDGWNANEQNGWNDNTRDGWNDNAQEDWNEKEENVWNENGRVVNSGEVEKKNERSFIYPVRPEAEDCSYYMRTGACKFGTDCKFNHPVKKRNQASKEKKGREEPTERPEQTDCKYYLSTGGCKYGESCRYNHGRAKTSAPQIVNFNFLGLPIRLGEKECPYYMRNGSCKYGSNCRFNHPDPTTVRGGDPPSGYRNGGSVSAQSALKAAIGSWSSPRPLNETYLPNLPMMFTSTHGVSSQSPEWNRYQAPPIYQPERSMPLPTTYLMNKPPINTGVYQPHVPVDDFPERPGQTECSYFLKTGDCKFKSNCKYHHPKTHKANIPPLTLSDIGLPLRPDQNICTHYSRYGICKFGPACKYDHPVQLQVSGLENQLPLFRNSSARVTASVNGNGASIQSPM